MHTVKGLVPGKGIMNAHATTRDEAFDFASEMMEAGAITVVISPHKLRTVSLVAIGQVGPATRAAMAAAPAPVRPRLSVVESDE